MTLSSCQNQASMIATCLAIVGLSIPMFAGNVDSASKSGQPSDDLTIVEHVPSDFKFLVMNNTQVVQTVADVSVSCGCIHADDIIGSTIEPGKSLQFSAIFDPTGMKGRISKMISVRLDPSGQVQQFPIEVVVRVRLALDRRDAAFGIVSDDADARTIPLRLKGTAAAVARIVSVGPPPHSVFRLAVDEDRRGLVVSLPPDKGRSALGAVAETWTVVTDDVEIPEISLSVSAIFENRISVSPSILHVSADEPVCSRTVLLRPNGDSAPFRVLSAMTKPRHWGDAVVLPRSDGGWLVRIDGIDPDAVRQFSKKTFLAIKTSLPELETIDVPLRVQP